MLEIVFIGEEFRGIGHKSLKEISNLPDSIIAEIVPVWREGVFFEIRKDGLYSSGNNGEQKCKYLFKPYENMIVDQYSCGRNLSTIAYYVAEESDIKVKKAFEITKNLFIRFCQYGWCHPATSNL